MSDVAALPWSPVGIDHVMLTTPWWLQHLLLASIYRVRDDMCDVIDEKSGRKFALLVKRRGKSATPPCPNPLPQPPPTSQHL